MRRKHGLRPRRPQAHPRRTAGALPSPQLAPGVGVSKDGRHERRQHGRIPMAQEPALGVSLFPAHPTTLAQLRHLQTAPTPCVAFTNLEQASGRGQRCKTGQRL